MHRDTSDFVFALYGNVGNVPHFPSSSSQYLHRVLFTPIDILRGLSFCVHTSEAVLMPHILWGSHLFWLRVIFPGQNWGNWRYWSVCLCCGRFCYEYQKCGYFKLVITLAIVSASKLRVEQKSNHALFGYTIIVWFIACKERTTERTEKIVYRYNCNPFWKHNHPISVIQLSWFSLNRAAKWLCTLQ